MSGVSEVWKNVAVSMGIVLAATGCEIPLGPSAEDVCANGSCEALEKASLSATCVDSASGATVASATCSRHDSLDDALSRIGADRCSLEVKMGDLEKSKLDPHDARRLSALSSLHLQPLRIPAYGEVVAAELDGAMDAASPVASAIAAAASRRGKPVHACPDPSWLAVDVDDAAPLAHTILAMGAADEAPPSATGQAERETSRQAAEAATAGIPMDLQRALVPILRAIDAAARDVVVARRGLPANQTAGPSITILHQVAAVPSWILGVRHFDLSPLLVRTFEDIDVDAIALAAARLALVVEQANLSRFAGVDLPSVDLQSPLGAIVLRGSGRDVAIPGDPAENAVLMFDSGGDDEYDVPLAASTVERPIAIAIDLGGNDRYGYVEQRVREDGVGHRLPSDGAGRTDGLGNGRTLSRVARQGAGVLGVGLLWDLGDGDDTYASLIASQGVGSHGVGVLYDMAGNDTYVAEGFSQGAAAWGIGLLLDTKGNDRYSIYNSGQGFGFTEGVGVLADRAGNDWFYSNPGEKRLGGDILYPSDQLAGPSPELTANHSMAQGCGAGHRPNWPDPGYPFPGGIGILRDAEGDDAYVTGVFGQGCGFVQGLGLFLEGGGKDTYDGLYYVQGAAAHMGLAFFQEQAGNEKYNSKFPVAAASIGVGHDFGVAIHYDKEGDDTYRAPPLSLGSGSDNGVGIFIDAGGKDVFTVASKLSLGAAITSAAVQTNRRRVPTTGVFVKAAGPARYEVGHSEKIFPTGDWSYAPDDSPMVVEKSVGLYRPHGTVALR